MGKQKYRNRKAQTFTVKGRASGHRAFKYQMPPEVADRLPSGATVKIISLSQAEINDLARQVEPEVTRWFAEKSPKNALEALFVMVQAIYALLQPPEMPIAHKDLIELAQRLAAGYDFAPAWPYSREQLEAAFVLGHPDLRPDIPDEHILFVADEVEKRLLLQLADEGVMLRDATQAGMLVVVMVHKMLCEESAVFGADEHEMYHIAKVLVAAHTFHPDWPYRNQVKAALAQNYHLTEDEEQ